jgi:hypothetical protein
MSTNSVVCQFDVVPFDQSGIIKTPNLISVNYTCQDFWSLKNRLVGLIKQSFGDDFNDFVESSLAIMLIENWAFCADMLSFKIDQTANEIFIDTVAELDNAFRLAMLVGFDPLPPIAATSSWSATMNTLQPTDLVITTPVVVNITTEAGPDTIELFPADSTGAPMLDSNIIIPAGSFATTSIVGIEGLTRTQTITGDGEINQFYQLAYGPVIFDSVRVTVDGVSWKQVSFFSSSNPLKEFRVEYDANYNGFIMFGNNTAGLIPSNGSQIVVTYRTGGGVQGNIVTGSVSLQLSYSLPGFNFRIPVSFTNYTAGQNGYNGDTIADIKTKLPAYLRMQNRIVTSDDYNTFINQFVTPYFGQIGKGTAVVRNYGCAANLIDVYVLAGNSGSGLQTASNELKNALQESIDENKMITDTVCIKDGQIIEVDVFIDVVMSKFYKKFQAEYTVKLNNNITAFFNLNNWNFGQDLTSTNMVKSISTIKEIETVTIQLVTDDPNNSGDTVSALFYQIIQPQTITINFVYD